jgi:hypothetical protein
MNHAPVYKIKYSWRADCKMQHPLVRHPSSLALITHTLAVIHLENNISEIFLCSSM